MRAQKRKFGMHQNLLYDVILRQAGTLQKAILEGVTNSIDAGATRCEITLDTHSFSIADDGHGFQSYQEIQDFFDVFGTPHEEGDAVYGRFRMGRGQLMAFGRNVWRSRFFEMHVDFKTHGIDYDLFEHEDDHAGTRVEVSLYDPVAPSELERIAAEIRRFVAWAQIPVLLNGECISQPPENGKWGDEDENAWYALSPDRQQLLVYNLGVLVNSFWAGRFGMGGTIVSKHQLEVNFARNDVQSTCPVFKAISARIKKEAGKGLDRKARLTEAERDMLVRDLLAGDMDVTAAAKLRCLTDVTGRSWPLDKLAQIPFKFSNRLVIAERGDQMIETAQRRGIAFSIDETTLERFGAADGTAFLSRVAASVKMVLDRTGQTSDYSSRHRLHQILRQAGEVEVTDRAGLSAYVSNDHIALEPAEITPDLRPLLAALERGQSRLIHALNEAGYEDRIFREREIRLGRSDTALAWTDGVKTIWVDVNHARLLRRGYPGASQIAGTLLHEMLHDGPDTGTHQHDFAFYQAFHDMTGLPQDPVGQAASRMVSVFISKLRQNKQKISAKLLARDDTDLALDTLRSDIDERADTTD